jgi:hypothetical protein
MVVLAAAVTTRSGKLVVSRQFVEMTRMRIEGLITAFPKLLGGGSQHTFVETDNVRYLYHPMDDLYMLLITSKQSSIVEDLETLKLLSRLWSEYCPPRLDGEEEEDDHQVEGCFNFVSAMDEVISLGYREQVTVSQVRTNMEMSSSEYRMHKELEEAKKREALMARDKHIEEMAARRATERKFGGPGLSSTGFGSEGQSGNMSSNMGGGSHNGILHTEDEPYSPPAAAPTGPRAAKPKGISIKGKTSKGNQLLDDLMDRGEIGMQDSGAPVSGAVASKPQPTVQNEAVNLSVEESAVISYDEDGNFNQLSIQGRIFLQITDADCAKIKIHVAHQAVQGWQFNTHPNIRKEAFFGVSDPWLMLAKEDRAFPCGNPLGILKWKYQTNDDSRSPISVTCWPSNQSGQTHCNLEYNLGEVLEELEELVIAVPLPGSAVHPPNIIDCDGETVFDSKNSQLLWKLDTVDRSNESGALEFAVPQAAHEDFFPVRVSFTSPSTMCAMQVLEVIAADTGAPVRFSKQTLFKVENYTVGNE